MKFMFLIDLKFVVINIITFNDLKTYFIGHKLLFENIDVTWLEVSKLVI